VSDEPDHPGVIEPPPFLFTAALAAGLLLDRACPLPFVPRGVARAAGGAALCGGIATLPWAIATLKGAGTNIDVAAPATTVVEHGPYAYSRNPIYVALFASYAGLATFARAPFTLALAAPLFAVMERGVVEREERYLERKFGERYVRYKSRVRRWL